MFNWDTLVQTGCLVFFIVVIVLIFFLFKPSSKNYYDVENICPQLSSLTYSEIDSKQKITKSLVPEYKSELSAVLKKGTYVNHVNNCKIYPIYIYDISMYRKINEDKDEDENKNEDKGNISVICIEENINLCPTLYSTLAHIRQIRAIYIYKLAPSTELPTYMGNTEDNKHIRCVLPIKCMKLDSGVSVNDEIKLNKINEWTVYDNSRKNYLFNNTNKPVIMLVIDIVRPSSCLKGINTNPPMDNYKLFEKIQNLDPMFLPR